MHTIHIDHLGPFVTSARKNTHLILAIDGFTKFAFLKAVRNTSVGPVLTYLDEIFSMFGVAQRIVCDRGSCFTSKRFISYCQTLNIKVNHNATATPRANGQAERYNRTILSCLAASTDDERKWDETLRTIQWGLNTTVNKTTGKTPYELLLGYQPRQANDAF
jgi:transposase InsO family protein